MKRSLAVGLVVVAWMQATRLTERWGTLPHEPDRPMPGDDLIPDPAMSATRALVVDAPLERVYPWFAQMGPGRAGWYSYDWIDNRGVASAREIHPEWLVDTPGTSMGELAGLEFVAADISAPKHLVIELARRSSLSFTLSYELQAWGESATRVVVRARARSNRGRWLDPVIRYLLGPGDFVMMRRQLIGVRERAER